MVEAQIAFCSHQRHYTSGNDVREAQQAENVH
jgi:hypothetical protein